ncbi:exendin-3-like [Ambystoma mexicanum]|uniref:exendin-3-like n=1 Tax=Ambystoma mexicanum TaxID=8296 RepID=UPI0037E873FF
MKRVQWISLAGVLVLVLAPASLQIFVKDSSDESRWQAYISKSAQSFTSNIKRHSEGTFTSDLTRYLDKMKAKDFVQWLMNTKRFSSTKRNIKEDPSVITLPSNFSLFRFYKYD